MRVLGLGEIILRPSTHTYQRIPIYMPVDVRNAQQQHAQPLPHTSQAVRYQLEEQT